MKILRFLLASLILFSAVSANAAEHKSVVFKDQSHEDFENYEDTPAKKEVVKPQNKPEINLSPRRRSGSVKIVAIVNGDMISSEDIDNRINAFVMTTQIPLNAQTEPMIYQRVLHNAIDEKIKLQEAKRNGIEINEKDIDNAIRNYEESNKLPRGGSKALLRKANVNEEAFRSQMKSDLAWIRLVRKKMAGDMTITQKEIEEALNETKEDINTPKYLISEIFIKKEDAKNLDALVYNLRNDPRFELYAMQFSQSPSAAGGGKLGWVNEGKMLPQLEAAVKKMKDGEVSNAINVNGDFYILKLNKSFNPKKDKAPVPSEQEIKKFLESQKLELFSGQHLQTLRQQAIIELRN